jgi:hypothetical protein
MNMDGKKAERKVRFNSGNFNTNLIFVYCKEKFIVLIIIQFMENVAPPELQNITSLSHISYISFSI